MAIAVSRYCFMASTWPRVLSVVGVLGLDGIWSPSSSAAAWASGVSRNSASFCAKAGSVLLAIAHSATFSTTAPSLGCAYSTGMPLSLSAVTWVGVSGNSAASSVWTISESLAELGMYSSTLRPTLFGQALKPGSTLVSLPPWSRLNIRKPCRPKVEDDIDWNTSLSLYLLSAMSIHEVGAAQPLALNSRVL